ncbi:hypothetical protein PILCRDRAFT_1946 [Piloderma croceum F 1598]|uniref:Uncharacterized protein n=1 Tax=Piloderma croceum (strain F 1598) TaxID=765440 RepID=A0A0C3BSX5_PILCF|nr:hypothetical protein PILCRDRAFT_1946 [Piloderma croceum F 1598]
MAFNLTNPSLASFSTHSSSEYKSFKLLTILPSIINSRLRERLGTPHVSISFAPDRQSSKTYSSFFEDTEYTKKNPLTPLPSAFNSSGFVYEPLVHIQGYVSPKCTDYLIWELGAFTEGSKVILGDELALAKITRVVRVGRNFIKFGVEALGSTSKDEIPVKRMIVSFSLDILCLTHLQRLKLFFFCRFLKSLRNFADEERVWDESDAMQGGPSVDYGKIICDMFGDIAWD